MQAGIYGKRKRFVTYLGFQPRRQRLGGVEHVAVAAPVGGVEARGSRAVEHLDQRVEIAAHVQDGALRIQLAGLHLGDDVEELVERYFYIG